MPANSNKFYCKFCSCFGVGSELKTRRRPAGSRYCGSGWVLQKWITSAQDDLVEEVRSDKTRVVVAKQDHQFRQLREANDCSKDLRRLCARCTRKGKPHF